MRVTAKGRYWSSCFFCWDFSRKDRKTMLCGSVRTLSLTTKSRACSNCNLWGYRRTTVVRPCCPSMILLLQRYGPPPPIPLLPSPHRMDYFYSAAEDVSITPTTPLGIPSYSPPLCLLEAIRPHDTSPYHYVPTWLLATPSSNNYCCKINTIDKQF